MNSIEALRQHLQRSEREIAIVVGAGLSSEAGIPDATVTLEQFRLEMRERGLGERLERELVAEPNADDYHVALDFIQTHAGTWLVDLLIAEAVRNARRPDAPSSFNGDGDPSHWQLPRSAVGLTRLLCKYPHVFRTPVLTTNFDPLLSLALAAEGVEQLPSIVHFDGWSPPLHGYVLHLHGYWRGDERGRHRPTHLTGCPRVEALIESKLRGSTVLVVGHGGRAGSLMRAFARLASEPNGGTKLLWCFHASEDQVRAQDPQLLAQLESWGARAYFGVDVHQLFEDLTFEPSSDRTSSPPETIINEVSGIELVHIPGGSFLMGSAADDELGFDCERPQHEVSLEEFYLARTPVTNAEYERYLAAHPDAPKPEYWGDRHLNQPDQPVVGVSWDDSMAYCEWAGLVLPTEAQWEYACRAGTTTQYWSGNEESDLARVGWYDVNSDRRLHAVGEKGANPFGLFDMHGNVWEWCRDGWVDNYETQPRSGDGLRREPAAEGNRVFRGGSWFLTARDARSAFRGYGHPGGRDFLLGFRPAQVIP